MQNDLAAEAMLALPNKYDFPWHPDILARKLPLLGNTFLETNRKHPAAAMGTSRQVGKTPLVVGDGQGIELPPHSCILIPPWTLHRNERYWVDQKDSIPLDSTISHQCHFRTNRFLVGHVIVSEPNLQGLSLCPCLLHCFADTKSIVTVEQYPTITTA